MVTVISARRITTCAYRWKRIMNRLFHAGLVCLAAAIIKFDNPLQTLAGFGVLGFCFTTYLIPRLGPSFKKVGLQGKDLSKIGPSEPIPESMGVVASITYMILIVLIIPFVFFKYLVSYSSLSNDDDMLLNYKNQYKDYENKQLFPHNKLAEFLSAALCLLSTIILGFFDDLFDIRWRHKFFLPAVASLPLLIVYYVDFSVTSIVVPGFLMRNGVGEFFVIVLNQFSQKANGLLTMLTGLKFTTLAIDYKIESTAPRLLDLGIFYYAYMSALSIFCPNSINILAGINGLEVGQSIVLGAVLLINDLAYLLSPTVSQAAHDSHLLSAIFLVPFLGVSMGLFVFNRYPARVFVGDTYCYFSGMVFAVVGILGHFSKTLLMIFCLQIVNFLYSLPQLFHVVPCPRHRLPSFNASENVMHPSFAKFEGSGIGRALLEFLAIFKLLEVKRNDKGSIEEFTNLTIINLTLVWLGPLNESTLCSIILSFQFVLGIFMLLLRHTLGPWIFGYDNLSWGVK